MRISDWSSDVCSSDLMAPNTEMPMDPPRLRKKLADEVTTPMSWGSEAFCIASTRTCMTMPMPRPSTSMYSDDSSREVAASMVDSRVIPAAERSEEHTSELQSLMRISYAVFCLKKTNK